MMKKTLAVILAAMILAVSACSSTAQPAATTTTAAPADGADIRTECQFYCDDIIYYDGKIVNSEEPLFNSYFEGNASELKKAIEQSRTSAEKILELTCPCEEITEQHEAMIAAADEYTKFLDSMERYAYYIEEALTRTDFTDEEMIELQELSEILADPYKSSAAFQDSRLAAFDAVLLYLQ